MTGAERVGVQRRESHCLGSNCVTLGEFRAARGRSGQSCRRLVFSVSREASARSELLSSAHVVSPHAFAPLDFCSLPSYPGSHHDHKQEELKGLQEAQLSHRLPGSLCMWGEFGGEVHLIGVNLLREKSEPLNCH